MGYLLTVLGEFWEASISAVGSHLTVSLAGILFLGFPASFWCGAYGYAIAVRSGMPFAAAFFTGMVLSALTGLVFAFFYIRVSKDSFAVLTLASLLAMQALLSSWDSLTGGVLGIAGVPRPSFSHSLGALVLVEALMALIVFVLEAFLLRAPYGRSLRAIKENKNSLASIGTSAELTGQIALLSAALFAGMAGVLVVMRIQFLDPTLGGLVLLVQILTISILANAPRTIRLVGITAVIVVLPELLRFFNLPDAILGYARNLLYGAFLMILIYFVVYTNTSKRYV